MKRPGYAVKITCFIEASPTDMDQMRLAISAIDAACEALRQDGFQMVKHETRFMLSREVGDAEAATGTVTINKDTVATSYRLDQLPEGTAVTPTMPPISAALDRRGQKA